MTYYIETELGCFISGLYYTEIEAQRGIDRYIAQSAKRYNTNSDRNKEIDRLRQSLKVELNIDITPPEQAFYVLRDEILRKIERDAPGTIYSRPLLIGMIKTRMMGKPGQYFEVSVQMKESALNDLFNPIEPKKPGVLIEKDGIITRSNEMIAYSPSINGWYKSYIQRV